MKNDEKYLEYWTTAISRASDNDITIRGYPLAELTGRISYVDSVILCLRGELPTEFESRAMNAIFTSVIDHQFISTNTLAARAVCSANQSPVAGLAAGVLAFGNVTAGVPRWALEFLNEEYVAGEDEQAILARAAEVCRRYHECGSRVPGFGHPLHSAYAGTRYTMRSKALRDAVASYGMPLDGRIRFYEAISEVLLRDYRRDLPINVDGFMGVILSELGYTPMQAHVLSVFTLLPGLAAHVIEEIEDGSPLRLVPDGVYAGRDLRHVADRDTG